MQHTLSRIKKIKGQVSGRLYAFLVRQAEQEKRPISKVLRDIVEWAINSELSLEESSLDMPSLSSAGSHCYLNFNLDAELLARWERFKLSNGFTNDSMTIRFVVLSAFLASKKPQTETQTQFNF